MNSHVSSAIACSLAWVWCLTPVTGFAADTSPALATAMGRLISGRCLECHAADRRGGLDLRSRELALTGGDSGPAVVPEKPDDSLLFEQVNAGTMPPKHPLSDAERKLVRDWIAAGAPYPAERLDPFAVSTEKRAGYDWWSLQSVQHHAVPAVKNAAAVRTPIDAFLLSKLEQHQLTFSPPASRADYLRRVMYDLTGLLPTYAEIQEFEADASPDAVESMIDRLLASPHYGERWGRHWLDVVRYAESNGFERDRIRTNFWPYRDYVIRSFNRDQPYDEFIREQLAGDALPGASSEAQIATGFLVAGPKNDVGTVSELEQLRTRQDELDDYVTATSITFLGLTVGCARCHDHKFDPIPSRDYYALTSVFSGLGRGDHAIATPAERLSRDALVAPIQARLAANQQGLDQILNPARERLLAERSKSKGELPPVNPQRNEEPIAPTRVKFVQFTIRGTLDGANPCVDEFEIYGSNRDQNLAASQRGTTATASSLLPGYPIHQIPHVNDGISGNSHSWISNEPGKGWIKLELPEPELIERIVWGRDREARFSDRLATDYEISGSLDGEKWTVLCNSKRRPLPKGGVGKIEDAEVVASLATELRDQYVKLDAERTGLRKQLAAIPALPTAYVAADSAPQPAFVLSRGDVRSRRDPVTPAALTAVRQTSPDLLPPSNDSGPQRRLRLAEWIADPRNPLTSRVWVNRVWQYHFGTGLVASPNDFGFNGDRPSHPELLDWLAADFVAQGMTTKRLHRMIVLSAAYRQSAASNPAAQAVDGGNRWLWRMSPRRLTSESLRDAILQASGQLDRRMGGPSYALFEYRDGNVPDYVLKDTGDPQTWRRGVYAYNIRTFQSPLMSAFDCPDPSVQTARRTESITALQALSLMNNTFVFSQADKLAQRVRTTAGDDAGRQAVETFRTILGRDPQPQELPVTTAFVRQHGLVHLCRVLLNSNELLYVR